MNKIDIIVRTKDRTILLERAIKSIIAQTYNDWKIILVNNGGNIKKVELLIDKYRNELNNRIRIIHTDKAYDMEVATNMAIKSGKARYITLLDDDDTWNENFLAACITILENNIAIGGVATQTTIIYEKLHEQNIIELRKEVFNKKFKKVNSFKICKCNLFTTNSFMYRRSILNDVGLYREDLPVLGDWEFNIRFIERYKVKVINKSLANYHKRVSYNVPNYNNTDINKHFQIDSQIRKEYFYKNIKQLKIFVGIGFYLFGKINFLKRKIKRILRKGKKSDDGI